MRQRRFLVPAIVLLVVTVVLVIRNQVRVYRNRRAGNAHVTLRRTTFELLQPVALSNCALARFGETHDGGYLMCGNLLADATAVYSYGIAGHDKWGCDLSVRLRAPLHQYDCFDTTAPSCPDGQATFHPECVGGARAVEEGRLFDTVQNQLAKNNDSAKRIVLKMDVEGAEWDSFLQTPDSVFERIDQMAVEFHWVLKDGAWLHDDRYVATLRRLKRFFHVAHLHFNNASCIEGLEPFPSWAYEVLFVNKRLGVLAKPPAVVQGPHALDAPNATNFPDCQVATRPPQ